LNHRPSKFIIVLIAFSIPAFFITYLVLRLLVDLEALKP